MAIIINPIDPVAFSVFGLPIRWYALAYIVAFVTGFCLMKFFTSRKDAEIPLSKKQMDDFLSYFVLGTIFGGRLGYVLFYNLPFFLHNPLEIFALWHGGMSFHGGFLGAIAATFLFVKNQHFKNGSICDNSFKILDILAVLSPIGLALGRIANFINMEVMGRATNSPLGVVFVGQTNIPRHPSPLYEFALEGVVLLTIMMILYCKTHLRKHTGALSGIFCILYAIFRIFCEQFRQPDAQIGFLTSWGLTQGMLLSGIMFIIGVAVLTCAYRKKDI